MLCGYNFFILSQNITEGKALLLEGGRRKSYFAIIFLVFGQISPVSQNFVERFEPVFRSKAYARFIDLVLTQKYHSEEGRTTNYVR